MNGVALKEWRSGTGKVVAVGDLVRVDDSSARYRVTAMTEKGDGSVEVSAYGGRPGFLKSRVFDVAQVIRCRSAEDPNSNYRSALHEASVKAKSGKRRR